MSYVIKTIKKAGYTLEIGYDECSDNPREWDSEFSTMLCGHHRYTLGEERLTGKYDSMKEEVQHYIVSHNCLEFERLVNSQGFKEEELEELQAWNDEETDSCNIVEEFISTHFVVLPVYMYEHSGIALSTGPFNCRWDSGSLGVIFTKITPQSCPESVEEDMKRQVEDYSNYVNGDVFQWSIRDSDGDFVESCGGYLGDTDYCEEDGLSVLEALLKDQQKAQTETVNRFGFAILED